MRTKMRTKLMILSAVLLFVLCGCGQANEQEREKAAASGEEKVQNPQTEEVSETAVQEEKNAAKVTSSAQNKTVKTESGKGSGEQKPGGAEKEGQQAEKKSVSVEAEEPGKKTSRAEETEQEEKKLPEYTVAAFEKEKTMFASGAVNVRSGPSTDFERVGNLGRAQEVTVTGEADTGWYEITFGEEKAFVSNHYLQDEKPAEEVVQAAEQAAAGPQEPPVQQAVTQVKNVAGVIMVGDSRFVQMQANIGENGCTWIAESGKGYNWFNDNAVARIDGCVGKGSKVLINLGVNDPGNLNNYLSLVNAKAAEWVAKGAKVYYASVNPVWENPYVTEEQVEYFNSQMQGGLSGDVHWIDSHSYLNTIGYKLVDGLHYNAETYQNLYAYFMSCL